MIVVAGYAIGSLFTLSAVAAICFARQPQPQPQPVRARLRRR